MAKNSRVVRDTIVESAQVSDEIPNLLDQLVSLVARSSTENYVGMEKSITVRLPVQVAARLEALAGIAAVSRNLMATDLIAYAAGNVISKLPADIAKAVKDEESALLAHYVLAQAEE